MLFSQVAFDWILTIICLLLAGVWACWDGPLLVRLLKQKDKLGDLAHRDKIFGSIIGLALCTIGFLGVLKFHLGW